MSALPEEILDLVRRSKAKYVEVPQDPDGIRREYFDYLLERYIYDDRFDGSGHVELWRMCGKIWNDPSPMSEEASSNIMDLMRVWDRVPTTYAQAAQLVRWHIRLHKPRVRVATSFGIQ